METYEYTLKVAADGSGGAVSIRAALDMIAERDDQKSSSDAQTFMPVCIHLSPGTYRERVEVRRPHITIEGSGRESTRIVYGLGARHPAGDGTRCGTFRTYTMFIDADDVCLSNLSVENDAGDGRLVGQAIALYADADRLYVEHCALLGRQDTLFIGPLPPHEVKPGGFIGPKQFSPRRVGRQYYYDCQIAGDVDFIFGSGRALFEACELCSLSRNDDPNGYVTAASTPEHEPYGFVLYHCRFTSDACAAQSVYLGRPWREWARVVLIACELGAHIKPEGWFDWNKARSHTTSWYAGTQLSGPGSQSMTWPSWIHRCSSAEAQEILDHILAGSDHWNPRTGGEHHV